MKVLKGLLFVMLLHTSFGVENRKIRRKRSVSVEMDPLFGKETDNEFELSAEEASKLDRLLQAAFMTFSLPTPSAYPTIYPSSAPSYVCPIGNVEGRTFVFVASGLCFRMQLFAGGKLEADTTASKCKESVFQPDQEFSIYSGIDTATNKAIFSPGAAGFSGTIEIKENPSINKPQFALIGGGIDGKIFTGQLEISSCEKLGISPSVGPSLAPAPSVPCSILDFVDQTFFFSGAGYDVFYCFRVIIGAGGELVGNTNDAYCDDIPGFVAQVQFSIFDSFDTANNVAIYTQGAAGFSGTIAIRETPSATKTELLLLSATSNTFAAALIVPACS